MVEFEKEILMKEIEKLAEEEQKKAMKEMQDVIVEKAVKIKRNQIKKIQEVDENSLDVNSIKKIVNPYQDFKKKFDIR
jgi:enhancing lycopene biosynthesis protein 2